MAKLINCSDCKNKISENAISCPKCGAPNKLNPGYGKKNRIVAALLAFFVGCFGIHRFYMGKTGSGIAMLILTLTIVGALISSIWAFVDFIRLLIMSDAEFQVYIKYKGC
jgi:TM2 domain-containing membrane protein YozV